MTTSPDRQTIALERVLASALRELLTEPMTVTAMANWFSTNRHKMRDIIDETPNVEPVAGMFRFPLLKMPPKYLVARGIIRQHVVEIGNLNED